VSAQVLRNAFGLELCKRFAERQSIRLGKEVRHELIMVGDGFRCVIHGHLRRCVANEFSGNRPALMHQLVEAVLAIGTWLTKDDRTSMDTSIEPCAILCARLSITLHIELLNMGWEPEQGLAVRENSTRLNTTDVRVVEAD